jgi:hypothetical protein
VFQQCLGDLAIAEQGDVDERGLAKLVGRIYCPLGARPETARSQESLDGHEVQPRLVVIRAAHASSRNRDPRSPIYGCA